VAPHIPARYEEGKIQAKSKVKSKKPKAIKKKLPGCNPATKYLISAMDLLH
jgi:hypothetical protein